MNPVVVKYVGFCKSYGDKVVHRGVNLEIRKGEILTLMGGSGSGKSVLLRALIGLETVDKGNIYFHDQELSQLDEEAFVKVRKRIAYVFQNGALFDSLTVEENLAYPLREHTTLTDEQIHARVMETLGSIGLEGTERLMPSDLSGGMQKRVGVARSIILKPEIILYDEPTSGLDPYNTRQILKIVLKLRDLGATSVLVSHDVQSLLRITDRVAFLKNGLIADLAEREEIPKGKHPIISAFVEGETP